MTETATARYILGESGLAMYAEWLCRDLKLNSEEDPANLKDEVIDGLGYLEVVPAAVLKIVCEECRREEKQKKVRAWMTRGVGRRRQPRQNSVILDVLDDIQDFWLGNLKILKRGVEENSRTDVNGWRTMETVAVLQRMQKDLGEEFERCVKVRDEWRGGGGVDEHYAKMMVSSDKDRVEYQELDDRLTVLSRS